MTQLVDSLGKPLLLGKQLGRGGEGTVYEVPSRGENIVAKIYHEALPQDKQHKLRAMVTKRTELLERFTAWPLEAVYLKSEVRGFLMEKATGYEPVHHFYSPADRKQRFPEKDWAFLVHVARNIATAFSAIHHYGHVIGDVNPNFVFVTSNGLVKLIDCDSFQIVVDNQSYLCEVGVPHFTPPELQSYSSFRGIQRFPNHDNFGLALLIFHILMMGRHPFSGVYSMKGDISLEKAIEQFYYSFGRGATNKGLKPPPNCVTPPIILPDSISAMFERAFTEQGIRDNVRPLAHEWVTALDSLRQQLCICNREPIHKYFMRLSACPWCELEQYSAIFFFIPSKIGLNSFDLAIVWTRINDVPCPEKFNYLDIDKYIEKLTTVVATPKALPDNFYNLSNDILKIKNTIDRLSIDIQEIDSCSKLQLSLKEKELTTLETEENKLNYRLVQIRQAKSEEMQKKQALFLAQTRDSELQQNISDITQQSQRVKEEIYAKVEELGHLQVEATSLQSKVHSLAQLIEAGDKNKFDSEQELLLIQTKIADLELQKTTLSKTEEELEKKYLSPLISFLLLLACICVLYSDTISAIVGVVIYCIILAMISCYIIAIIILDFYLVPFIVLSYIALYFIDLIGYETTSIITVLSNTISYTTSLEWHIVSYYLNFFPTRTAVNVIFSIIFSIILMGSILNFNSKEQQDIRFHRKSLKNEKKSLEEELDKFSKNSLEINSKIQQIILHREILQTEISRLNNELNSLSLHRNQITNNIGVTRQTQQTLETQDKQLRSHLAGVLVKKNQLSAEIQSAVDIQEREVDIIDTLIERINVVLSKKKSLSMEIEQLRKNHQNELSEKDRRLQEAKRSFENCKNQMEQIKQREKQLREKFLSDTQTQLTHLRNCCVFDDYSDKKFREKFELLSHLQDEYKNLSEQLKQEQLTLEQNVYDSQLNQFLDQFLIKDSTIPSIGSVRKNTLLSFGIETAADIDYTRLINIPRLAKSSIQELMNWREKLKQNFRFNPTKEVNPLDIRAINQRFTPKLRQLEGALLAGPEQLSQIRQKILQNRSQLLLEVEKATQEIAQAKIDLSLCQ